MNTAQTIIATGFDIANLAATAQALAVTHNVDVLYDDDGNAVAGFVIVGKNSPEYQAESHAVRAEGHQRSATRKSAIDAKTDEGANKLVDIIDSNATRLALSVVVDWYGFTSDGAKVPFDKKLVAAAFKKFPTWEDKVSAALEADSNFLKVSSPASSPSPATSSNA
nr:hypothetical protein [uncultured Duganella sp.]